MAIKIQIPAPLRQYTEDLAYVEVSATSIKLALDSLASKYPALTDRLMDNGKLRPFVNLFVNDEDIRYLDGLETALNEHDTVSIIPAIGGG